MEIRRGGWDLWLPRDGGNVTRHAAITFSIFPNCVCANEMPAGPRGVISNTAQRLVPVHLEQKKQRAADTVGAAGCRRDVACDGLVEFLKRL